MVFGGDLNRGVTDKNHDPLGGGATLKSLKKSKSISGIFGWVLTFLDLQF